MTIANRKNIEMALMRNLTDVEAEAAQLLLNHAENLIHNRVPSLGNICDADASFADLVAQIEANAAARVIRGDGNLHITDMEFAQLRQNRGVRTNLPVYQSLRSGLIAA